MLSIGRTDIWSRTSACTSASPAAEHVCVCMCWLGMYAHNTYDHSYLIARARDIVRSSPHAECYLRYKMSDIWNLSSTVSERLKTQRGAPGYSLSIAFTIYLSSPTKSVSSQTKCTSLPWNWNSVFMSTLVIFPDYCTFSPSTGLQVFFRTSAIDARYNGG